MVNQEIIEEIIRILEEEGTLFTTSELDSILEDKGFLPSERKEYINHPGIRPYLEDQEETEENGVGYSLFEIPY